MATALLRVEKTYRDAMKLANRFQQAPGFRDYLRKRLILVVPAMLVFVLISLACAAGPVIFLAERHALLALPGLVLSPVFLLGSFFVQAFVFFSWLEGRAVARALRRPQKKSIDFGAMPNVPWALAGVFLLLPLSLLSMTSAEITLVLIVLAVLTPILFARFDR
jgi:hypothetical protein